MSTAPFDLPAVEKQMARLARYRVRFWLDPAKMAAVTVPATLDWDQRPFNRSNAPEIAERPGVYAFAIAHNAVGLPPHSYILYIGQAGAKGGATRTLRARFKEYLREPRRVRRPAVALLLDTWPTCLVFCFATVDPDAVDLLDVERQLNDAMMPPFSQEDFSAEIRAAKRLSGIVGAG